MYVCTSRIHQSKQLDWYENMVIEWMLCRHINLACSGPCLAEAGLGKYPIEVIFHSPRLAYMVIQIKAWVALTISSALPLSGLLRGYLKHDSVAGFQTGRFCLRNNEPLLVSIPSSEAVCAALHLKMLKLEWTTYNKSSDIRVSRPAAGRCLSRCVYSAFARGHQLHRAARKLSNVKSRYPHTPIPDY